MRQYLCACITALALLFFCVTGTVHSGSIQPGPLTGPSGPPGPTGPTGPAGGGGGGSAFSGDMQTTFQTFLNSTSTTNTAVVVQDDAGLEVRNAAATTGATVTSPALGTLRLFAGQTFQADTLQASTGNGNLTLSPNGSGTIVQVLAGKIFAGDTIQASSTNADLVLQPNGTATNVTILSGKILQSDTLQASATNGNLTIKPNGTGTKVIVTSGKILDVDTVEAAASNGNLTLQPNGSGTLVTVLSGKILQADTVQAAATNGDLTVKPNGSGSNVTVPTGKTLQVDIIQASTTNGSLTIQPNGSGTDVIIPSGKTLLNTGAAANGVGYWDSSSRLQATAVGTAGNVLTSNGPGVAPSFQSSGGGGGGTSFNGDMITTTQRFLNSTSTTNTAVVVQDDAGLEVRNAAATTGATVTSPALGTLTLFAGQTFQADTVQGSTTNGDLTLKPNGSGSNVIVLGGKTLKTDIIANATAATNLALQPTGSKVTISTGKTLDIDTVEAATTNGVLTLQANGSATDVVIPSGNTLLNTGKAANGIAYWDPSARLQATAVGTAGQVLTSNGSGVAPTFQPATGGGGGGSFSGDVFTTSQTYLNTSSTTQTAVMVRNTAGLELANSGNTVGTTLSAPSNGIIQVENANPAVQTQINVDFVQARVTNGNLNLQPNGTGTRVIVAANKVLGADTVEASQTNTDLTIRPNGTATNVTIPAGKILKTDNVTSSTPGALTLGSGGGNTAINLTPSGTGNVSIQNGRMGFADAGVNPATTGFLFRVGTDLIWYNGTVAIKLNNTRKMRIALAPGAAQITGATTDPLLSIPPPNNSSWSILAYNTTTAMSGRWAPDGSQITDYAGGAITVTIRWYATAITGNVKWDVSMVAIPAGTVMDTAYGSAHSVTSAPNVTTLKLVESTVSFTPTGTEMTAGSLDLIQVKRDTSVGSNMAGDANLVSAGVVEN